MMAHAQVVGAVEHAAVGVAAAVDHVAVALGRRHVHARGRRSSWRSGFRGFRGRSCPGTPPARCTPAPADVLDGLEHVGFVLHGDGALVDLALGHRQPTMAARRVSDRAMGKQSRLTAMMPSLTSGMLLNHGFHAPFIRFSQGRSVTSIFTPCQADHQRPWRAFVAIRDGQSATCSVPTAARPSHSAPPPGRIVRVGAQRAAPPSR